MAVGFVAGSSIRAPQSTRSREAVCMSVSRRDMLKIAIGSAAAALAPITPALADGSVSAGTRFRARGIYGNKILSVKGDVESVVELVDAGEWVKVQKLVNSSKDKAGSLYSLKNSLQLFKTGYFADSRPKQKAIGEFQDDYSDAVASLERAAKKRDVKKAKEAAAELKKAYEQYIVFSDLKENEFVTDPGQAWSSDFDYRRKF